jgi:hypothetical protein
VEFFVFLDVCLSSCMLITNMEVELSWKRTVFQTNNLRDNGKSVTPSAAVNMIDVNTSNWRLVPSSCPCLGFSGLLLFFFYNRQVIFIFNTLSYFVAANKLLPTSVSAHLGEWAFWILLFPQIRIMSSSPNFCILGPEPLSNFRKRTHLPARNCRSPVQEN